MFKLPNNAFANVNCPNMASKGACGITNCFFNHETTKRPSEVPYDTRKRVKTGDGIEETSTSINNSKHISDPKYQPVLSGNIAKQELPGSSPTPVKKDLSFVLPKDIVSDVLIPRNERTENAKKIAKFLEASNSTSTPNRSAIDMEFNFASESTCLADYRRKVHDYLGIKDPTNHATDPKHIIPLDVTPSPAMLPVRRKFIELFVEAIKRTNPALKTPVWTAIEEEFKIASTNSTSTYTLAVKRKLYELSHPEKVKKQVSLKPSKDEYLKELQNLCIPREKLVKWGFIMDVPKPIAGPEPVRQCNRCKMEFKLEDSSEVVDCRYHQGRLVKNEYKVRVYSCCGGVFGETDTEPCTKGEHHVFYWSNPEEMHHFLPFIETRHAWTPRKGSLEAIGIDCEMGFTTKGFELLRITAIDFFSGEEVLDILVRPKGKVLDLNTRWSGVAEIKEEALTFEDSITLLGEIADANTVMIGHGLENDMNAMRLIHDKIVDTAVLYPKHKTSPTFRFSLKQLSFQYLGRAIQAGEHDSGEDSLAAIDVTKYFIEQDLERCKRG
ncbi:hypothetical protein JCM33374_g5280 [Metschnikowia sp. JCM 33374]|nr:hypothetical protein JCM33374_g5280 [Metschnikowia sp. JCM 33374]